MPAAGRTVRHVGAAKPVGRISALTSGTLFAFHKMPLRAYLMAVAIFCNEVENGGGKVCHGSGGIVPLLAE
jgi:hypothetical protein